VAVEAKVQAVEAKVQAVEVKAQVAEVKAPVVEAEAYPMDPVKILVNPQVAAEEIILPQSSKSIIIPPCNCRGVCASLASGFFAAGCIHFEYM
jgi:hypothetical protein